MSLHKAFGRTPALLQRFGIEQSEEAVELVRRRIPGINLISGDILHPGLELNSFDIITFWHVLEHLPDPARALQRTADLLRPGGIVLVSLPAVDSLQAALFRRHWYGFDDVPRHLHHFSSDSLKLLLDSCGLAIERRLMFSRSVSFHALKHSLLNWSSSWGAGRLGYYPLKPLLFGFQALERITGWCGIRTVVARAAGEPGPDIRLPAAPPKRRQR